MCTQTDITYPKANDQAVHRLGHFDQAQAVQGPVSSTYQLLYLSLIPHQQNLKKVMCIIIVFYSSWYKENSLWILF